MIESAASGAAIDAAAVNAAWLGELRNHAIGLFDKEFVGTGPLGQQQPRRIAEAYQRLAAGLKGPKLREALGLPVDPAKAAARKATRGTNPKGARS